MFWNATKRTGCNPTIGFDPFHDRKPTAPRAAAPAMPMAIEITGTDDPLKPIIFKCGMPECPGDHDVSTILKDHFTDAPPAARAQLHSILEKIARAVESDPMMVRLGVALHKRGIEGGDPIMIAFGAQPFTRIERGADGAYAVVVAPPDEPERRTVLGPVPRAIRDRAREAYRSLDPRLQFEALSRMISAGIIPAEFGIDADAGISC